MQRIPGNNGNNPGNKEESSGNNGNTPGNKEESSGNNENTPGNKEENPGNNGNTPGNKEENPGNNGNILGNNEEIPGNNRGILSNNEDFSNNSQKLLEIARPAREKFRLRPEELRSLILLLCSDRFLTLHELSQLLNREASGLRKNHIKKPVKLNKLELRYPDTPSHKNQAYKAVQDI
ncbi:hypothetical protein ACW2QC_00680 [Virgibacillus sp. FSP13]